MIDYSYSFPVEDRWRELYASNVENIIEHIFVAFVDAQQELIIDPNEHDQYKWCHFNEAFRMLSWPENKEALKRCNELVMVRGRGQFK